MGTLFLVSKFGRSFPIGRVTVEQERGVDVKHKRVPATGPAFCSGQCGPTIQIQYGPRTGILPRIDTIHL